jgi:hypothetical protein
MTRSTLLFAAPQWQEKLQEFHEQLVPEWVGKTGLPIIDPMPMMNIAVDVTLGLAAIALLIALWRLLTLRIFRSFFAVIAALLIAYYPAAYAAHWFIYEHQKEQKDQRETMPEWELKVRDNIRIVDWSILGAGVFIGGTLLLLSRPRRQQEYVGDEVIEGAEDNAAPWHQAQQEQRRSSSRQKQNKNPFDFS